jgi:M6 family metalloprotease-like protein
MKTITHFCLLVLFLFALVINLNASPFDTGMITFTQPNDATFTGRMWGDEFIWWAETEDGYRFIQSGDGWYYYATLDESGEYAPTMYKVGIDTPPGSSYQLERTQTRIDEISEQVQEFNEQIELNRQWFAQEQLEAQGQPLTLKVGIIVIEFSDIEHYKTTEPPNNRPDGYFTSDFDSLMFSYDYWFEPNPRPGFPSPHPENEPVFGSFRDYWHQMSLGNFKIVGRVANPTDENGVPRWLKASGTRAYYLESGGWALATEAYQLALDSGYISENPHSSNYFHKICIVYAREAIQANLIGGDLDGILFYLPERCGPNLFGGGPSEKSFTHIGLYAHEFGHTLGLNDEYIGLGEDGATDLYNFCLMTWGSRNGPDRKGACPATLSPYQRIKNFWVAPDTLDEDEDNFIVEYNYLDPKFFCIVPVDATEGEHYIVETKNREGFDLYIPSDPADTVDQTGRLIIWQHNTHSDSPSPNYTDRIRIIPADNIRSDNIQSQLNDFFPADFYNNNQSFNDTSSPRATINETNPGVNQPGDPAYFVLNGIQKLSNGNTLISEISPNQITLLNNIAANWQTVSVGAIVSDYSATSVFPTATPPVYQYIPGQGYVVRSTLANGPGYWVKFNTAQTLIQKGKLLDSINIRVSNGWNLIGSISFSVPYLNICTEPPGIINTIYYYNGGYHYVEEDDTLKPSVGYWFKSNSNGNVILLRNFNCPENEGIDLSGMDKFIVTDSDGKAQELYVANVDIDTMVSQIDRSLPPPVPDIDFDARFNYGEFIKTVSVDSGEVDLEIDVQTTAYPITLSWEINPANGIEYSFISDSGFGKISQINNVNNKLTIDENSQGKIKLFGKVSNSTSSNIPEKYELFQNYPNPFNPITTIRFAVSKESLVNLSVFNILGEKVKELKNEIMKPGYYEVNFNAAMLASGIYLYRIQAGEFVQTEKMILMK